MLFVQRVPSRPPLLGRVELAFYLDGYEPEHHRERIVPNGRMSLVIELDGRERYVYDRETEEPVEAFRGAWFSGVHSRYFTIGETRPVNRLLAVQFAPGVSNAFTHRPASDFADRVVGAETVFGDSISALRESCIASRDAERALDHVSDWLAQRHDPSFDPPCEVRDALARICRDPSSVRFTEFVAEATSISYRHFVELFRRHVGTTPKVMQRILRFQAIFAKLEEAGDTIDWASLSQELGYSDQAHFIKDFREFSGYRPVGFHERGHDRSNFFPEDEPAKP